MGRAKSGARTHVPRFGAEAGWSPKKVKARKRNLYVEQTSVLRTILNLLKREGVGGGGV